MLQGYYGKGINSGSSSGGAGGGSGAPGGNGSNSVVGQNGTISSSSPLVTVHVDPHPATGGGVGTCGNASVQQKQQSTLHQAQQSQHHGPVNGSGGNPAVAHHQLHHSHHPLHHHHPHHHLQHVTFANTQAALSMTNHYQTQGSLEDQGIDMTQVGLVPSFFQLAGFSRKHNVNNEIYFFRVLAVRVQAQQHHQTRVQEADQRSEV